MSQPAKSWKFVLNNWKPEDRKRFESLDVMVIAFGEEVGEKGTPHLQGHVRFKRNYRLSALKKICNRTHWEEAKCEDFNYELKGDNIYVRDERKKKGQRSDLERVADMARGGSSIREIANEYPGQFIRYGRGIRDLMGVMVEPRNTPPNVVVYWGETGTGKSRKAREDFQGKDYYVWTPQRGKWFDGYMGHKNVIFEEFRGQLPLGFILTILDRYECPVEYKGGTTEFVGTEIIITSPKHPRDWYENMDNDNAEAQLLRRISVIVNLCLVP